MKLMRQTAPAALVVLAFAAPAAAQDPEWLRDLERTIERQVDAVTRALEEQVARLEQRQQQRGRRDGPELTEPFTRTARLGANGTFDLENVAGNVVVTGGGGNDVRIEATRRVRGGSDAAARAVLQDLRIQVAERGGNVEVRTISPRRRGVSTAVDYTISLPETANVTVHTVSGTVRVTNIGGELRAESVSGDITASSVEQVRSLQTVSGNLSLTDGEADEIQARTVSGQVTVSDLTVRRLDLESVSGDLRLTGVDSERVRITSVSGNIEYGGRLARNGDYELTSHSGNLRVLPEGDDGFEVEASTFSGTVRSDYPLTQRGGQQVALGFASGGTRGLRGTFGSAGAALVLHSFSGNVTILRR